ncbi:MAG: 4Fe-4S binding protein [Candidatus Nezhaarchaeota archaeon]|nr:4Fe-4S binding protein [Candidatus Nezhaarchaeota archaeon]MCX8142328.1 4Fe-4S binding protein [Candidatus Nezhaarchaeota archaeon]MDW8050699.1 4Fe-4S binding protein [Nitrososphaerota archaeon]
MSRRVVRRIVRIDESKCDGCGLCVSACPEGALKIVNGKARLVNEALCDGLGACIRECPRGAIVFEEREAEPFELGGEREGLVERAHEQLVTARLNWPIKLELINPRSPAISGKQLIIVADCVPFVYSTFKRDYSGGFVASGCPIFGDNSLYRDKIAGMLKRNEVPSLKVVRMEVPCCSRLTSIVAEALRLSGKRINLEENVIGIDGAFMSKQILEVS